MDPLRESYSLTVASAGPERWAAIYRYVEELLDSDEVAVLRANLVRAGLADRVEVRVGAAIDTLAALHDDRADPFDLDFIDPDKPQNAAHLRAALKLSWQER